MEITSDRAINFAEEFSSKIPALTLLTTLGYQFIPKQPLVDKVWILVDE